MAIQVRRGNEVDFDPSKMLPGEWAVSLDTKYVRMCFSPGVCLRMATYESFEADMAEIQSILAETRTIQEAVARIQTEINDTAVVVEDYSILAQSYAVGGTGTRENEDSDNAKYYYEQTKQISQGINGIVPMGTVTFANLPTEDIVNNAMYNVSDAFVSDERFNDGGGVSYGPGNNVIWTAEGKWDVTASSAVTGIKGANETTYRQGNVDITAENVGALPISGGRIGNDDAHIDVRGTEIVGDTNSEIKRFSYMQASTFEGNLRGTATQAEQDKNGNDIADRFYNIEQSVQYKNLIIPGGMYSLREYLIHLANTVGNNRCKAIGHLGNFTDESALIAYIDPDATMAGNAVEIDYIYNWLCTVRIIPQGSTWRTDRVVFCCVSPSSLNNTTDNDFYSYFRVLPWKSEIDARLGNATIKSAFIPTSTLKEFVVSLPEGSIVSGFTYNPLSDYPAQVTRWNIEIRKPSGDVTYTSIQAHWLGGATLYLGSCDSEGNISWSEGK